MLKHIKNVILGQIKSYDLLTDIRKKTDEITWSAIFNSAIIDSSWFKIKSLNPGRWAAGYPMLYILYRVYNDIKPKSILEFGLGETSKLSYQYHEAFPESELTIIEQDQNWLNFFSKNIHNVIPNTVLLDIEYRNVNGFETKTYDGLIEKVKGKKFDFILVDGPWGSDHFSRYQVVDLAENDHLADKFVIIIDDYDRKGEQETASKLREILKSKGITFVEEAYHGIKSTLLICSGSYKFLASL